MRKKARYSACEGSNKKLGCGLCFDCFDFLEKRGRLFVGPEKPEPIPILGNK